ncbi:MAG: phosphohydrolase [Deltaproteobacteria bacterium HGW-Deltaproteobacteria-4]|nr:MAG: phosphohydrolase [Deltaproteobacteria bacterium HGW-Deltaproteobacteria-4]
MHTDLDNCAALEQLRPLFPPELYNRIFLVGGAVRDLLLGRESVDLDLVVALPEQELTSRRFREVKPKDAPPIHLYHSAALGKVEATCIGGVAELADDLRRRDFTVNALALDLEGKLYDPLGGVNDLNLRQLRPCSAGTFSADPTRLFRAFRFAADGWSLAPQTTELIESADWHERLQLLPIERFSAEMSKAFAQPDPGSFFVLMLQFNVGRDLLPELFRMPQIPAGPLEHHPEGDLFTHNCEVLANMVAQSAEPRARFCAFFHDLGKLATDPALYPKHHGHDDAGFTMAPAFCNRLALPATWRTALAWSSRLHGPANRWQETRDSTRIRIAEGAIKGGISEILPQLTAADWPEGPGMPDWHFALAAARLSSAQLDIDAEQLERLTPVEKGSLILQKRVEWLRRMRREGERQKI